MTSLTARGRQRLTDHLDEVMQYGVSRFSRTELLFWFNKKTISKTVWREMLDLWDELIQQTSSVTQTSVPLYIADNVEYNASYTIIWGEGLDKSTLDSTFWFKDLKNWT